MKILTRMCISLDGFVTTPDGWPAQLDDPDFSPESYGFIEFQQRIGAVLMGRATFEPALGAQQWPWEGLDVYVLGSHRPDGTPDHVIVDSGPERLLERLREAHPDSDVHLVGGPSTIESFRAIGALDRLGLLILPRLLGGGQRLTPPLAIDTQLTLTDHHALANGVLDVTYELTAPESAATASGNDGTNG